MITLANKLKCKLSSFRNIDLTLPSFMSVSFYLERLLYQNINFFFKIIFILRNLNVKKNVFRFSYKFFPIFIHIII